MKPEISHHTNLDSQFEKRIIVGGFGGQGVILTGDLLSLACLYRGYHVSNIPSYGAEMRGGTARCSVVISNNKIASPLVFEASILIALNLPSMKKFESLLEKDGILIYNSTLILEEPTRSDIQAFPIPAGAISHNMGSSRASNIACIGKLLSLQAHLCSLTDLDRALDHAISERNKKFNPINKEILRAGFSYSSDIATI